MGQGGITVNSEKLTFRDCKVWPEGAKEWDWTITDTHHVPGTQPMDIEEVLQKGVEVMVLSRGMQLVLQTCPETEELLRSKGIPYHTLSWTQNSPHQRCFSYSVFQNPRLVELP